MFKKKTTVAASIDSPGTVIGKDVHIEAICLMGKESVRIEGVYKGLVNLEGSLVLGESGSITGDVHANYFLVAGEVVGNIHCSTQLHLVSTAKVMGDIQAPSLIVDEGSQVTGRFLVGVGKGQEVLETNNDIVSAESLHGIQDVVASYLRVDTAEDYEEDVDE